MKKLIQVISVILILTLCLGMFSVMAFAEEIEEPQEEEKEVLIEDVKVETIAPEVKLDEVAEVVELDKTVEDEPEPELEPEPTITYPFTVTYHFYYRSANGAWKDVSSSQKVTYEGFNNSKAVSFFSRQIRNNNLQVVNTDEVTYTWLGTWSGDLGTLTDNDRVYTNTSLFQSDADISFYADYSEKIVPHLTFICNDQVANGSHSAANIGAAQTYHYTFKTPADIPEHYTFLYWENGDSTYVEGDQVSINVATLDGNVTITCNAVYKYQPAVQVNYHYSEGVVSVSEYKDIDIYASAPVEGKWFYEDSTEPIAVGTKATLPEQVITTVPMDEVKTVDVYARYFTISWVNEDGKLLEKDENVPYGAQPSYDGATPTKKATEQYKYTFKAWTPALVEVTADATYTATYNAVRKEQPVPLYTITYMPGDHGLFQPQATTLPYGSATPPAPAVIGEEGYQFTGWSPEIGGLVTGNAVFTAQWQKITVPATPTPTPTEEVIKVRIVEDVEDDETPLAAPDVWALANLILLVGTIFTLWKYKKKYNFVTPIAVLAALGLFIFTENIHNPMVIFDKWTVWQLLIFIVGIGARLIAKEEEQEENTEEVVV